MLIYNLARDTAEKAWVARRASIFQNAKQIAETIEDAFGQLGTRPASTWNSKTGIH